VAVDDGAEGSTSSSSSSSDCQRQTGLAVVSVFVVDSGRVETCFVSSVWLCEVRHFPGVAFSSHCTHSRLMLVKCRPIYANKNAL